jgi:hypothetical protein
MHTKASIQTLLDRRDQVGTLAVIRALEAIYDRQEADERAGGETRHDNGRGFSKFDAPFLTEMVEKNRRWNGLTPKQLEVTRNKIKRYWRQLVEIANERAAQKPTPAAVPLAPAVVADRMGSVSGECRCENYDGEGLCPACEHKSQAHLKRLFADQERRQEEASFRSDPDFRYEPGSWA